MTMSVKDVTMESEEEEEQTGATCMTWAEDASSSRGLKTGPLTSKNPVQRQATLDYWLECIEEWYPDRHQKAYFLPPFHFRRTHYEVATVADQPVLIPRPPCKRFPTSSVHDQSSPAAKQVKTRSQSRGFNHQQDNLALTSQHNDSAPVNKGVKTPLQSTVSMHQQSSSTILPSVNSYPPLTSKLVKIPVQSSVYTHPQGDSAPLRSIDDAHAIDDNAAEHLLGSLQAFCDEQQEVVMVISQLDFRKYLDKQTNAMKAACARLPQLPGVPKAYQSGDFDILMIHRHHGLVIGELKAVGTNKESIDDFNTILAEKVQKAMMQLDKAEVVLQHFTSDVGPLAILKTLFLPNLKSCELEQALRNLILEQRVEKVLGTKDVSEAARQCLCGDQMPSIADLRARVTSDNQNQSASNVSSSLKESLDTMALWWKHLVGQNVGTATGMSDDVYDQLLARFCGPATTVEVPSITTPRRALKGKKLTPATKVIRTRGQAVAETGLIMSLLTLYPEQVRLLTLYPEQVRLLGNDAQQFMHLYGPPGTGKTVILVLKASQWLGQRKPVHVVSLSDESRCISYLIHKQLEHINGTAVTVGSRIHLHVIKTYKSSDADKLAKLAIGGELYVIADEVVPVKDRSENPSAHEHTKFESFIVQLKKKVPFLHLWCASIRMLQNTSLGFMTQEKLTAPLRSPPVVTREVSKSVGITGASTIPSYCDRPVAAPTDGPPVHWLRHHKESGHYSGHPMNCRACGEAVVNILAELGVGKKEPDSLQCRDVFILCPNPSDLAGDKDGIVSVLRENEAKVMVLKREDTRKDFGDALKERKDVALAERDEIVVTDYKTVSGLERRVIIGMGTKMEGNEMANRLLAMSRCTAQLVWIGTPTRL